MTIKEKLDQITQYQNLITRRLDKSDPENVARARRTRGYLSRKSRYIRMPLDMGPPVW